MLVSDYIGSEEMESVHSCFKDNKLLRNDCMGRLKQFFREFEKQMCLRKGQWICLKGAILPPVSTSACTAVEATRAIITRLPLLISEGFLWGSVECRFFQGLFLGVSQLTGSFQRRIFLIVWSHLSFCAWGGNDWLYAIVSLWRTGLFLETL